MSSENVNVLITPASRTAFECSGAGCKVRFPDESNIYEESFHRSMLGFPLSSEITMTRNDRSEQDLDTYNEGCYSIQTDTRELGHR
ncbi:hypothetical protein WH47_04999 [Habropoda laboriosa]|uniref:Uncharacterized protein n=1 Tax=Habropoda laboriosa TaxID=597456 RepID=A0A0L7RJN9_9HYME|nr:hypothetical protein WH47_04999 [Habropoda laboriosa]